MAWSRSVTLRASWTRDTAASIRLVNVDAASISHPSTDVNRRIEMAGLPVIQPVATSDELCCLPMTQQALSEADANELAVMLAALSDPIRLRLFSIVAAEGEVCSCNL